MEENDNNTNEAKASSSFHDETMNDEKQQAIVTKEMESAQKKKDELLENYRLRHVFIRPKNTVHRHPIFSSPFAKHITAKVFGRRKPRWYKTLDSMQLSLFKSLLSQVDMGRQGYFRFSEFLKTLQEFDSSVTRSEVVDILDEMNTDEFEELDFGKFLFLLAYRDNEASNYPDLRVNDDDSQYSTVTPRQGLILSAIANFILITSPEDINKYYAPSKKNYVKLHHRLDVVRLEAFNETEMEKKQLEINRNLDPLLYEITGSPYARPVPLVPRFTKGKIYQHKKKPHGFLKRTVYRPLIPDNIKRKLNEDISGEWDSQEIVSQMNYGRLPLPDMKFSDARIGLMKGNFTEEMKANLVEKALDAKRKFREQLNKATVLYARKGLVPILRKGFPTKRNRDNYIDVYQKYLPIQESEMKYFSLWIQPSGYEGMSYKHNLDPEKYAFGSKIR